MIKRMTLIASCLLFVAAMALMTGCDSAKAGDDHATHAGRDGMTTQTNDTQECDRSKTY